MAFAAVVLATLALLLQPRAGETQRATTVSRIGFLSPSSSSDPRVLARFRAFQERLRELGYVDGQNIALESRWAEGNWDRLPGLAAELVRQRVDVLVTYGPPAVKAAKEATGTIPIVMAGVIDPVAAGFVASLARPGGNITGMSLMAPEMVGKQLEIVKQVAPKVSRVAVLGNPVNAGTAPQMRHARDAVGPLRLRLQPVEARTLAEIDSAFAAMTREHAGAVVVLVDSMFVAERARIANLAAQHRLPAVYGMRDHVEAGGLIAYGSHVLDRYRRAATFVDKILKGAKPGDLPVEQPNTFELVINLGTAKALRLTIPQALRLRADHVID